MLIELLRTSGLVWLFLLAGNGNATPPGLHGSNNNNDNHIASIVLQDARAAPVYDYEEETQQTLSSHFYDDNEEARSIFPELGHVKYREMFLEDARFEELLKEFDVRDDGKKDGAERAIRSASSTQEPSDQIETSMTRLQASGTTFKEQSHHGGRARVLQGSSDQKFRRSSMKQFISTMTTCNANIASATCVSWSTFIETQQSASTSEVKIPCGSCVTLDVNSGATQPTTTVILPHGLNIVGKLHIPEDASVEIFTKFVLVQGILRYDPPLSGTNIPRADGAKVTITLTGTDTVSFTPDADTGNADQCESPCTIGIKPFAVAGGMMDINAIDPACPTWAKLETLSTDKTTIKLIDRAAASCWAQGAEILFTSEDSARDHEIATVASTDPAAGTITLTSPLAKRKTSVEDGYGEFMAVEVALLERNFRIQPDDTATLIGGHVIVYHTPTVHQKIEGVELFSMGQQGNIGRYPLHFHMSENCKGSLVRKNLVRKSNQRCYVMHGTHNVTLEENVAFDSFGHCYMTEDGAEWSNTFRNNLGAYTRKPANLISAGESDNFPATFWMTQPSNHMIGNVAAGSESSGFWLEARIRHPGKGLAINAGINPRFVALGSFINNTAHSNWGHGVAFYPIGYVPRSVEVLKNVVTFKNTGVGVFFHGTENIKIEGGYFGDNRIAMRNFGAPNSIIEDVTVVGISDNRKQLVAEGRAVNNGCRSNWEKIGITVHPAPLHAHRGSGRGTILNRVQFINFDNATGCTGSHAIMVEDDQVRVGIFNAQITLSGVTFQDTSDEHKVDACKSIYTSKEGPVTNIAIEDHEGRVTGVPGFLVQENDSALRTFLPDGGVSCKKMAGGCLFFCPNACLQLATVSTSANSMYAGYKMVITDDRGNVDQKIRQVWKEYDGYNERAYFGMALPGHSSYYKISFVNQDGDPAWPGYVDSISYERHPQNCMVTFQEDSQIVWDFPEPSFLCNSLMKNGDFELGSVLGWQNTKSDFDVMQPGADGSNWALITGIRNNKWDTVRYTFDPSCFRAWSGEMVQLSGKIRTQNNNGGDISCASGSSCAPKLRFQIKNQSVSHIVSVLETQLSTVAGVWSYFETNITLPSDLSEVGQVGISFYDSVGYKFLLDDWNLVYMNATITSQPSKSPTSAPTTIPTSAPTKSPNTVPVKSPTTTPVKSPTTAPLQRPTTAPVKNPTIAPVKRPTTAPSKSPINAPTTKPPSKSPTSAPTTNPPSIIPTSAPTKSPTTAPVKSPTTAPVDPQICIDNLTENFLLKLKKNKQGVFTAKHKNCNWLKLKSKKKQNNICGKKTKCTEKYLSAQKICPETCNFCDKCKENVKAQFYLKTNKKGNNLYKTCSWLKKETNRASLCSKTNLSTTSCQGIASVVCPITCAEVSGC